MVKNFHQKKYSKLHFDFQKLIEEEREGKLSTQLNYTKNGFKSIIKNYDENQNLLKKEIIKIKLYCPRKMGRCRILRAIQTCTSYSYSKYLKGVDMYQNEDKNSSSGRRSRIAKIMD